MKIASKWCLGMLAAVLLSGGSAFAQSLNNDPGTGAVRISSSQPKQKVRPVQYQTDPSGSAELGGGYDPVNDLAQGQPIYDPAFRAANGLGEPTYGDLDHAWYRVGRQSGQQYGYPDGFTTLSALLPVKFIDPDTMFAFNPYLMMNDDAGTGMSVGTIFRRRDVEHDRVFGAGIWWDYDRANVFDYHRLGISLEAITRYVSYRFNYNAVIGEHQRVYGETIGQTLFQGNGLVFQALQQVEAPYDEVSLAAAWPLPCVGKYGAEGGVGIYGLFGNGQTGTAGVQGTLNWQITEDFSLQWLVSHDRVFDTRTSLGFELTIPDAKPSRILRPNPVAMAMVGSTQRNFRTPVVRTNRTLFRPEINTKTGLAYNIAHIDPNAAAGGAGTIASPFQSLFEYEQLTPAQRAAFDIVRVIPRTDGTSTNLDTGITLFDTQRLLSSSLAHSYTSDRGTFVLPGQTVGFAAPVLSDVDAGGLLGGPLTSVITLAGNATEVSGFRIESPTSGIGIASAGAIDGFNINRNTFTDFGIAVDITSDTTTLLNCPGEDHAIILGNTFAGRGFGSAWGVDVDHVGGTLGILVADNNLTAIQGEDANGNGLLDPTEDGNGNGVLDPGEDANGNGTLDLAEDLNGNGAIDNGVGIDIDIQGGIAIADTDLRGMLPVPAPGITELGILRNTITSSGDGIIYNGRTGTQSFLSVQNNNANNNAGNGLTFAAGFPNPVAGIAGGPATIDFSDFLNNSATDNGGNGAQWLADNGSRISTFDNNPTVLAPAPILGNDFSGNGGHGMYISGANGSTLEFQIGDPNDADPAFDNNFNANGTGLLGGDGLHVNLESMSTISAAAGFQSGLYGNSFNSNQGNGATFFINNSTFDNFQIIANAMEGNGGDGLLINGDNVNPVAGGINNLLIANNQINLNVRNGINFQLLNSNLVNHVIVGNTIDNNGGGGAGPGLFTIDVVFGGGLTPTQQAAFAVAAARWEQIIIGDLPDVGLIDDVQIAASGVFIDGAGGILGQAGPTGLRPGTFLPFTGIMEFDTADLANMEANGSLTDVILHEMGHVIGIGTIWNNLGLLSAAGTVNPRFLGPNATAEYNARFANADPDVPVEGLPSGPGSRDSHWRETIFGDELMTPFLSGAVRPISRVTIGQLEDIGYSVNYGAADPFLVASSTGSALLDLSGFNNGANLTALGNYNTTTALQRTNLRGLAALTIVDNATLSNGINYSLDNSTITNGIVERNSISGNGNNGVRMVRPQFGGVPADIDFLNNDIDDNGNHGVEIVLDNANQLEAVFRLNQVTGNLASGVSVTQFGTSSFTTNTAGGTGFTNNTISGNGVDGYVHQLNDSSVAALDFTDSTFSQNGQHGINIHKRNFGQFTQLDFNNLTVQSNQNDGAHLLFQNDPGATVGQRTVPFNVNGGIYSANGVAGTVGENHGIHVVSQHDTILNATVADASFLNNDGTGLLFEFDNSARTGNPISLMGNEFTGNADGAHILTNGDSITTANIVDNLFSGNVNGFVQTANNASSNTVNFNNNMVENNTGNGVDLNATTILTQLPPGTLTFNSNGNTYTGNTGAGVDLAGDGGTSVTTINNSQFNSNGDGIRTNVTNGTHTVNVNDNMILASTDAGIDSTVTGGTFNINVGTAPTGVPSNTIAGSGDDGVRLTQSGGTTNAIYRTLLIRDSGDNGFQLASSGGILNGTLTASNILSNTGRGVEAIFTGTNTFANAANQENQAFQSGILNAAAFDRNFTITNNGIQGNGEEGVFLSIATTGLNTNRISRQLAPFDFFLPDDLDFEDRLRANILMFGNTVSGNGTIVDSHGTHVAVGVNTLMQLDYRNNTHSGNQLTDFFTRSFNTFGNPGNSTVDLDTDGAGPDVNGNETFIRDDVAELRLRFQGNNGESIAQVSEFGATYTNADPLKPTGLGNTVPRNAGFFDVEPLALDGLNTFTQDATVPITPTQVFNNGGYNILPAGTNF